MISRRTILVLVTALLRGAHSFTPHASQSSKRSVSSSSADTFIILKATKSPNLPTNLASSSSSSTTTLSATEYIQHIEQAIRQGNNPRSLIEAFEQNFPSPVSQPNRSPLFLGTWHVHWTDCPPPSNGQLGPFRGTSGQVIDAQGQYQNILQVPPNNWLSATLDGVWEDWDGTLLPMNSTASDSTTPITSRDWGADHWKVTFVKLRIAFWDGKFTLLNQVFPPNTSRVWRTTYLDDATGIRIVRAGRTGKVEDEYVFYTKRTPVEM
jgi:hypothetical protein